MVGLSKEGGAVARSDVSRPAWLATARHACALFVAVFLGFNSLSAPAQNAPGHPNPAAATFEPDIASVMLLLLGRAGVDFSVSEAEVRKWLGNRAFTPYPAIADALLLITDGRRLRQPVYLDVIVWNYEHAPGATSPRDLVETDFELLRTAVTEGYNERYGTEVAYFAELLQ